MKIKDIRNMDVNDLNSKINDLEKELSVEYSTRSSAAGKSRNYGKIRTLKRTIARIKTIIREKELGIAAKPQEKEKKETKKKQ